MSIRFEKFTSTSQEIAKAWRVIGELMSEDDALGVIVVYNGDDPTPIFRPFSTSSTEAGSLEAIVAFMRKLESEG